MTGPKLAVLKSDGEKMLSRQNFERFVDPCADEARCEWGRPEMSREEMPRALMSFAGTVPRTAIIKEPHGPP